MAVGDYSVNSPGASGEVGDEDISNSAVRRAKARVRFADRINAIVRQAVSKDISLESPPLKTLADHVSQSVLDNKFLGLLLSADSEDHGPGAALLQDGLPSGVEPDCYVQSLETET